MTTVHKYKLFTSEKQLLVLPVGSKILSVQEQYGEIVLYAMVDTSVREVDTHTIYVYGTGHRIEEMDIRFIGTVKLNAGTLMFHVFAK